MPRLDSVKGSDYREVSVPIFHGGFPRIKEEIQGAIVLTLGGMSASGKSVVAKELVAELKIELGVTAHILGLDTYYSDLTHLPREARDETNFDHVDSQDEKALSEDYERLRAGLDILRHSYCYAKKERMPTDRVIVPKRGDLIIFEGVFAPYYVREGILGCEGLSPEINAFLDVDPEICFDRRKFRDLERGYDVADVEAKWPMVKRGYEEFGIGPAREITNMCMFKNERESELPTVVEGLVDEVRKVLFTN